MSNNVNKRADKSKVVGIENPKDQQGRYVFFEGDGFRLRKELDYYTMTCDLNNCEGIGRYDDIGEVICQDCGRVISQKPDGPNQIAVYADKYCQTGNDPDSGHGNRGASGHPLMRVPALTDPGPSGDDSMGGVS